MANDVLENLLDEIAQNQRDVVIATLYSWTVAVRLFQNADRELSDRFPDHEETKSHEWTLNALIRLGRFCEARLGTVVDKDLNDYQMSRAQFLADLGELEELAEERKDIL
jgi:hypothetical protein